MPGTEWLGSGCPPKTKLIAAAQAGPYPCAAVHICINDDNTQEGRIHRRQWGQMPVQRSFVKQQRTASMTNGHMDTTLARAWTGAKAAHGGVPHLKHNVQL
jgi:hypothetical protein